MQVDTELLLLTYNQKGGSFSQFLTEIKKPYEFVVIALQESCHSIQCSYFCWNKRRFEEALFDHLMTLSKAYKCILSVSLNAQALLIYTTRSELCSCMRFSRLCVGRCGANKGAIIAHMCISGSPVCFAACHFEAGTDARAFEARRVHLSKTLAQVYDKHICIHQVAHRAKSFLLGDLNFRVQKSATQAVEMIASGQAGKLLSADELITYYDTQLRDVLPITFDPTFKFLSSTLYSTEKCPSFTDRIVTLNDELAGDFVCDVRNYGGTGCGAEASYVCVAYDSIKSYESDHLPVFAVLQMRVQGNSRPQHLI